MYIHYNPNPYGLYVEDCVVRAICLATGRTWDDIYFHLCLQGGIMGNMPSVNEVWGTYLSTIGFSRYFLPDTCPVCYTVRDFCYDHPHGTYILATNTHVITVINGNYYDAWDSGSEVPLTVWRRDHHAGNE